MPAAPAVDEVPKAATGRGPLAPRFEAQLRHYRHYSALRPTTRPSHLSFVEGFEHYTPSGSQGPGAHYTALPAARGPDRVQELFIPVWFLWLKCWKQREALVPSSSDSCLPCLAWRPQTRACRSAFLVKQEKKNPSHLLQETQLNAEEAAEEAPTQLQGFVSEADVLRGAGLPSEAATAAAPAAGPGPVLLQLELTKACGKCRKVFSLSEMYQKSKNTHVCANCNRLSTFLARLSLPEGFRALGTEEMCSFYGSVAKMTAADGKLSLQKVSTAVTLALETSVENSSSSTGSDYLPLSVWAFQGWDPKLVEQAGVRKEDPKLGTVYKMEILNESVKEQHAVKRKEGTTVNLRAKKSKKTKPEEGETLELVSSDEEEKDEKEDKETRKQRKLREKTQLKKFKKDTAAASKAVALLSPLVLQVTDTTKKAKAESLLAEARVFLASGAVDATLSFETAHVTTEATLLRAEAKPAAAPKRRAKAKAKAPGAEQAGE